ncbi:uncharacterized protein AMSG_00936 [Thecamonas trahens ATCC 50062]|uniref:Uncharacterized protein n=1 Tax=Thecamonas trahens ATCC 50062 TaxID=461836 RepID=A0A0L0DIC9_THETB|nr:hypothetical protein AMSG_00936 [Thecamonas trahens ATCC 50062]KNC52109.1 hypothetical protein AMSG_00936 [Thecamonas trahens ATCC 50062]|eukprot:XP_013762113.1 hypothetical protein AMSG_00936 [Thecamonas trahens ATCC 50062]
MEGTWGVRSPCGLHPQPPLYTLGAATRSSPRPPTRRGPLDTQAGPDSPSAPRAKVDVDVDGYGDGAGAGAGVEAVDEHAGPSVRYGPGRGQPLRRYVPRATPAQMVATAVAEEQANAAVDEAALVASSLEAAAISGFSSQAELAETIRKPSRPLRSPYQRSAVPVTTNEQYGWEEADRLSGLYDDTSRYPVRRSDESKFFDQFYGHGFGAVLCTR